MLEEILLLSEGSKVLVNTNINIYKGVINGSAATVKDIIVDVKGEPEFLVLEMKEDVIPHA